MRRALLPSHVHNDISVEHMHQRSTSPTLVIRYRVARLAYNQCLKINTGNPDLPTAYMRALSLHVMGVSGLDWRGHCPPQDSVAPLKMHCLNEARFVSEMLRNGLLRRWPPE